MAMILLAALLSVGVTACTKHESHVNQLQDDPTFLFQEKNIGRFGLRGSYKVVLTFDDGPSSRTTSRLLDLLKKEGVRATFFVVGEHARKNRKLLARLRTEGHLIGNHSDSHANLSQPVYSEEPQRVVSEIQETHSVIASYLDGQRRPYFRAPYGAWKTEHAEALNVLPDLSSYVGPIYWTAGARLKFNSDGRILDAADWECWSSKHQISVEQCAEGYLNAIEVYGGGVVLMHDGPESTVALVRVLIQRLKVAGYEFVTLDDLEALDQYQ
jgi:peptidoglycan/xylan/chitin deacetylase (PgdA/CDA1 family)